MRKIFNFLNILSGYPVSALSCTHISSMQPYTMVRFYSDISNNNRGLYNSKFAPWKVDTNNIPLTIDLIDTKEVRYQLFYNIYKLPISINISDFGTILNSNNKGHYYINFNNNNLNTLILIQEDNKLIYKKILVIYN